MGLKERIDKLCDRLPPGGDELDRLIEIEIERVGVEAAQEALDEVIREYQLNESGKQDQQARV
jgi:hypothetical protein